jgi:hypothetical protein
MLRSTTVALAVPLLDLGACQPAATTTTPRPVQSVGNAAPCVAALWANSGAWAKAFGFMSLPLMTGCTAAWGQGAATGVSFYYS